MNRRDDFLLGLILYTGFVTVGILILIIPPMVMTSLLALFAAPSKLMMAYLVTQAVWAAIAITFFLLNK